MEFTSEAGRASFEALLTDLPAALLAFDFDGTLSPIVADPEQAWIHPDAPAALSGLAGRVRAVAIITARPVLTVARLAGLQPLAKKFDEAGTPLEVFGQYGAERWSADRTSIAAMPAPEGLLAARVELPQLLAQARAAEAYVEDKGLALAVHTRRLPDPDEALARLMPLLIELAARHGLVLEPGRLVLELRALNVTKADALAELVSRYQPKAVLFGGDDLGDLPAYDAIERLAESGMVALKVCAASGEQLALRSRADIVVDGPGGMVELLQAISLGPTSA